MRLTIKQKLMTTGIYKVCIKKRRVTFIFFFMMIFQCVIAHSPKKNTDAIFLPQIQKTIQGTVSNDSGFLLAGANVMNKQTRKVVQTDIDGNFSIEASDNKTTLVISYIGLETQEVVVRDPNVPLQIFLVKVEEKLKEVVIVGYNTVKKENLIGAVQTITNKGLNSQNTQSVENLLAGKIAGVYVTQGSGRPGDAGSIVIRGKAKGLFGNSDPLWVVDGVILTGGGDLGNDTSEGGLKVNPNDIETITVLKDAASTAMYGSQGTNGVIIVTTKKGKSGKARINFSTQLGAATLNRGNFSLMDGAQLYDYYNSFPNKQEFSTKPWWKPELRNRNFDWWNANTTNGLTTNHNLSISGGSELFNSYISLGAYDQKGAIKGGEYSRYTANLNFSYRVNEWFTIKPALTYTLSKTYSNATNLADMATNLPWDSPYLKDGTLVGPPPHLTWVNSSKRNYMYNSQWNYSKNETNSFRVSLNFDIKLSNSLTFTSINHHSFEESNSLIYEDPRSTTASAVKGEIGKGFNVYIGNNFSQLLKYNKVLGNHDIGAVIGYEFNESINSNIGASATGIPPGYIIFDVAALPKSVRGGKFELALQSFLSNFTYAYKEKYLAQLSLRSDGASNFAPEKRYGIIYDLGLGWNIQKENFLKSKSITQLKIRANYGSVGNRPQDPYSYMGLYSLKTKYNEGIGATLEQYPNPNISWENTYTTAFGLDIGLYNRFNLSVDFYDRNTRNLLWPFTLPGVTGLRKTSYKHIGAIDNRGVEATIDYAVIQNTNWKWNIAGNIARNTNKITSMYNNDKIIINNNIMAVGEDIQTWYMAEWAGVDPQTGKAQWFTTNTKGERVKTFSYYEAAQNPIRVGTAAPSFFGGFSTNVTYKNFELSALFTYSVGGQIYNELRQVVDSDGARPTFNQMNLYNGWSRWQKPGDIATHPQAVYNNRSLSNSASSRYLETADFLKLDSFTLGYYLNVSALHISNLKLFVSGQNLFTISHFSGPPNGGYNTRQFVLGLNLTL